MKVRVVFVVFAVILLVVGGSSVLAMLNGNNSNEDPYTGEDAEEIAWEFLVNSETFKYDGLIDTAELSIVRLPADPDDLESTFTYTFQTGHYGHGDRSDQVILPVVTDHVIEITVAGGRVIKAICCGTWDEINGVCLGGQVEGSTEITDRELDPGEIGVQEGFVIDVSDSRILVVSEISKEEALKLNADNILEANIGGDAVWYSVEDATYYKVGQLLRVKSEFMMESYPARSEAILVQIVEEP